MSKLSLVVFSIILSLLHPSISLSDELSCKHLFHDHSADKYRVMFLSFDANKQIDVISRIMNRDTHSYLKINRHIKMIHASHFVRKTLLEPIYEKLYQQVGFFTRESLRFTIIEDINGETWAILVSQQISLNTVKNIALYSLDYDPKIRRKGPVLIKSLSDGAIL